MTNKAAQFADKAEALGWDVQRKKNNAGTYYVFCSRGEEKYNLSWAPGARGLAFDGGWHWVGEDAEEITSPAASLKAMAKAAPVDLATATDVEIIDYLANRRITWLNTLSGLEEDAVVPPNSPRTSISTTTRRILHFVTPEGFKSVALEQIVKVG